MGICILRLAVLALILFPRPLFALDLLPFILSASHGNDDGGVIGESTSMKMKIAAAQNVKCVQKLQLFSVELEKSKFENEWCQIENELRGQMTDQHRYPCSVAVYT